MKKSAFRPDLSQIPTLPGIYKMLSASGEVIYVGKAKNLRKRVSGYFVSGRQKSAKTEKMLSLLARLDFVVVDSELEAILLETNLIKELRPKYNILMKDDKNFAYIKIVTDEDFPRLIVTRQKRQDGGRYFGPKTSAHAAKETLKLLKKIFPFRHCPLSIELIQSADKKQKTFSAGETKVKVSGNFRYPCIDYYIKRCPAPCLGKCSSQEYRFNIDQIIDFLSGKTETALELVKKTMLTAAASKNFEAAAKIRDRLNLLESITAKQKISSPDFDDLDLMAFVSDAQGVHCCVFQIRNGKMINQCNFSSRAGGEIGEPDEILSVLIENYYREAEIPPRIYLDFLPAEDELLASWLTKEAGFKVQFKTPRRGQKNELLALAQKNALLYAASQKAAWAGEGLDPETALENLRRRLELASEPKRIECYDISHLAGSFTVGAMTVLKKGRPSPSDYRSFKLRGLTDGEIDDFRSLTEVLRRRLLWLKPHRQPRDLRLLKAGKKEKQVVEKLTRSWRNPILSEQNDPLFVLKRKEEILGFVRLRTAAPKIFELCGLWIAKKVRGEKFGHLLLRKATSAAGGSKVYLLCAETLQNYYAECGFRAIHDAPTVIKSHLSERQSLKPAPRLIMVYDRKHRRIDTSFQQKPDLILIDGGKGQLAAAAKALNETGFSCPLLALAKKEEVFFLLGANEPLSIDPASQEGLLLRRLRDEAHRFAIDLNRDLQGKAMTVSGLDSIKGVGSKIRSKLLRRFGSVTGIKNSDLSELKKLVGEKLALKIKGEL